LKMRFFENYPPAGNKSQGPGEKRSLQLRVQPFWNNYMNLRPLSSKTCKAAAGNFPVISPSFRPSFSCRVQLVQHPLQIVQLLPGIGQLAF
jgi:hypothetical protein